MDSLPSLLFPDLRRRMRLLRVVVAALLLWPGFLGLAGARDMPAGTPFPAAMTDLTAGAAVGTR